MEKSLAPLAPGDESSTLKSGLEATLKQRSDALATARAEEDRRKIKLEEAQTEENAASELVVEQEMRRGDALRSLLDAHQQNDAAYQTFTESLQDADTEASAQWQQIWQESTAAETELDSAFAESTAAEDTSAELLARLTLCRKTVDTYATELEQRQQTLQSEFNRLRREQAQRIQDATHQSTLAEVKKDEAENLLAFLEAELAETRDKLADAEHDCETARAESEQLAIAERQEMTELAFQQELSRGEAAEEKEKAWLAMEQAREDLDQAEAEENAAKHLLTENEQQVAALAEEICSLRQALFVRTSAFTEEGEALLRNSIEEQAFYVHLRKEALRLNAEAATAKQKRYSLQEQVDSLREEVRQGQREALSARNLEESANVSQTNAGELLAPQLTEIHQALKATATEANEQVAETTATLAVAENELAAASIAAEAAVQAAETAAAAAEAQEKVYQAIEIQLQEFNQQAHLSAIEDDAAAEKIMPLLAAYQDGLAAADAARDACSRANDALLQKKDPHAKAERDLIAITKRIEHIEAEGEAKAVACRKYWLAKRAELDIQLSMAEEKRQRLLSLEQQQSAALLESQTQVAARTQEASAAANAVNTCRTEAENVINALEAQMAQRIKDSEQKLQEAKEIAAAAQAAYEAQRQTAAAALECTALCEQKQLQATTEMQRIGASLSAQRETIITKYEQDALEISRSIRERTAALSLADRRGKESRDALLEAKQKTVLVKAAYDEQVFFVAEQKIALEQVEAEHMSRLDACKKQLEIEEAEARLAELKEAQRRLAAEEQMRILAEGERLRLEAEAEAAAEEALLLQPLVEEEEAEDTGMAGRDSLLRDDQDPSLFSTQELTQRLQAYVEQEREIAFRDEYRTSDATDITAAHTVASQLDQQAATVGALLDSAHTTYANLSQSLHEQDRALETLRPVCEGRKKALDQVCTDYNTLPSFAEDEKRIIQEEILANAAAALAEAERAAASMKAKRTETEAALKKTGEQVYALAEEWLAVEREAIQAHHREDAMQQAIHKREKLGKEAQERLAAAKAAAAAVTENTRRIGSISKLKTRGSKY